MSLLTTLLSTVATVAGVVAVFPQLWKMHNSRNSSSQSPMGWQLGGVANASLLVVNLLQYRAYLLALGNGISLAGCVAALAIIAYHSRLPLPEHPHGDLRTNELHDLHGSLIREYARRSKPLPPTPPPTLVSSLREEGEAAPC